MDKPRNRKFADARLLPCINTALLIVIVIAQALILFGIYSASFSRNRYKKQENNLLLTARSPSPSGRGLGVRVGEAISRDLGSGTQQPFIRNNGQEQKAEDRRLEMQNIKSEAEQINAELDRFFDCIVNNPEELFSSVHRIPANPGPDNLHRMHEDMSRVFNRALINFRRLRPPLGVDEAWNNLSISPSMDIRDSGQQYVVSLTLPGVESSDINVSIENKDLIISVQRNSEQAIHRNTESLERRIRFPAPVDADQIQTSFENGVLRIAVPKARTPEAHHFLLKSDTWKAYNTISLKAG